MKKDSTFFTWLFDGSAWCDLVGRVIFVFGIGYMITVVPVYYLQSDLSKKTTYYVSKIKFLK